MNSYCRYGVLYALAFCVFSAYASLVHITDEKQYNAEVTGSKKAVLVQFSADWCSVCNGIQQPIEEIAAEPEFERVTFAHVDVDKCDGICKQYGIVGVPTFIYMENGEKKVEEIGVQNIPTFKDHLRTNLRKNFTLAQNNPDSAELTSDEPVAVTEEVIVDVEKPIVQEPNFFIRIVNGVVSFFMMIIAQIKSVIMMLVDTIKNFFTK